LRWQNAPRTALKRGWELGLRGIGPRRKIVHAATELEAEACRARMRGWRVAVVPHAVEIGEPRATPPLPLELLFFSRLHPSKGIERLLEACALARAVVPLRLSVCGSGDASYREAIAALVRRLALEDCVSLLGYTEETERDWLLCRAHALVLPSYHESFAMAAAEALARGVPVIAARETPWEVLEREGCGYWTDGAPPALAAAIVKLARAPLEEMGRAAHAFAARTFSRDRVGSEMIALYRSVCSD
jgi:glycosyltransferase involved in cell wall biosynthesis